MYDNFSESWEKNFIVICAHLLGLPRRDGHLDEIPLGVGDEQVVGRRVRHQKDPEHAPDTGEPAVQVEDALPAEGGGGDQTGSRDGHHRAESSAWGDGGGGERICQT